MTPFAHAIAQQLGAPVPGAVFRALVDTMPTGPALVAADGWEPEAGSIFAKILTFLRANPDQDIRSITTALGLRTSDEMYNAMQELRRKGVVTAVRKVGNRNIWRAL